MKYLFYLNFSKYSNALTMVGGFNKQLAEQKRQ